MIQFSRSMSFRPDWDIIRSLFRFGLPAGFQGIAMNVGGLLMLRFIGSLPESAEAQAVYAVCYTELFSLVTWTSVGLMGAAATVAGQNLGAGRPDRSARGVRVAAVIGLGAAAIIGLLFLAVPHALLAPFGMSDGSGGSAWPAAVGVPGAIGLIRDRRADLHRRVTGHGGYARVRSTSRSPRR